ncbi:papain-like cysteine protease family protein [Methylobacterium sp. WSM2598]|uniref:papain-like cysteine protease family protein n=1 Tax=Methylobacterium sp. WSM2598 TaxID=398261 RepID=UPI00035D0DEC|nr:papain-like cysteine protease family protein [Methylobacterium sp. WSM2598]
MPIPQFLSPRPIQGHAPAAVSALGGSAPPLRRRLSFGIEQQEQDNWCWAAVGVSIEHFYAGARRRTQCALACTALGRQDCCADGGSDTTKCDKPWYLDRVLKIVGHLEDTTAQPLTFAQVQARIDAGSVVGCRIGWYGGGGHFVAVIGYLTQDGRTYLDIADPIWMETQVAYDEFPSLYRSGGDWTHSYLTAPTASGGAAVAQAGADDPDLLGA